MSCNLIEKLTQINFLLVLRNTLLPKTSNKIRGKQNMLGARENRIISDRLSYNEKLLRKIKEAAFFGHEATIF